MRLIASSVCEHPTIVEARDLYLSAVVPPVTALSSLLRYTDFWALSSTGRVPLSALVKYVAVCFRVCPGLATSLVALMSPSWIHGYLVVLDGWAFLYYYISRYAIAISAIGTAPQAVTKNSEVEQNTGKLRHV